MNAQVENTNQETVVELTEEQKLAQAQAQKEAELKALAEKIQQEEKELSELAKLIVSGKATTEDLIKLTRLSNDKALREQKKEQEATAQKLVNYVKDTLKVDIATAINYLRLHLPPVAKVANTPLDISEHEVLYRWVDSSGAVHNRINGEKATAKWAEDMVKAIPKFDDALDLIVATSEMGKTKAKNHLKKVYKVE
jgi:hypothetical protein